MKKKHSLLIFVFLCSLTLFPQNALPVIYDLQVETSHQIIYGRDAGDQSTVQAVGDLNGDQIPDLILTALRSDGPGNNKKECGEVYIFFGRGIIPCLDIDLAVESPDIEIYGDDPDDYLGASAAAGDVNGDGIDDLLIAAPRAAGLAGEVYIIYGRSDLPTDLEVSISDFYDVRIRGASLGDQLGMASWNKPLALGDVNGDGIKDVLVIANSPPKKRIYLIYGSPSLPREIELALGGYDLVIYDSGDFGSIEHDLYSGDFDGDGYDDIIFSVVVRPGDFTYEQLLMFYGREDLNGEIYLEFSEADLVIENKFFDEHISFANPIAMGDLNGDGNEELLVSEGMGNGPDGTRNDACEVYIFYGGTRITGFWDLKDKDPDVIIYGAEVDGIFGVQVNVGNLNGDSYLDIIGMALKPSSRYQAGEVFIIPGTPNFLPVIDLANGGWDLRVLGADEWDRMGSRIISSDLNLDGIDELILGSWGADGPDNLQNSSGETVILYCTPCVDSALEAGPNVRECEGVPVTLRATLSCLPNCPVGDYRFRWIDDSTGIPVCDWSPLPSCTVAPNRTTTFTAEAMCESDPGTVLQDQVTVEIVPDPIPDSLGNTLRAVKEGSDDIRFTWVDLTMQVSGYELMILASTDGPPTPANMDQTDVVHDEVVPPGDQNQIHESGLQQAPDLNFYKVRALSLCSQTPGPTGN